MPIQRTRARAAPWHRPRPAEERMSGSGDDFKRRSRGQPPIPICHESLRRDFAEILKMGGQLPASFSDGTIRLTTFVSTDDRCRQPPPAAASELADLIALGEIGRSSSARETDFGADHSSRQAKTESDGRTNLYRQHRAERRSTAQACNVGSAPKAVRGAGKIFERVSQLSVRRMPITTSHCFIVFSSVRHATPLRVSTRIGQEIS